MPTTFKASSNRRPGYLHVLLITTGSVASVKAPLIVEELLHVRQHDAEYSAYGNFDISMQMSV